jgi:hypothetical protein
MVECSFIFDTNIRILVYSLGLLDFFQARYLLTATSNEGIPTVSVKILSYICDNFLTPDHIF